MEGSDRSLLTDRESGYHEGKQFEHEGCDIVIASLQTMISRKLD
jgi:hypothetical protein